MPELPEVETVARDLNEKIGGRKIVGLETNWPKHFSRSRGGFKAFQAAVLHKEIKEIFRRGKQVIFHLHGGTFFSVHLKMTGNLLVNPPDSESKKHIHVRFVLSEGDRLAFSDIRKFGRISLTDRESVDASAPDPFEISRAGLQNLFRKQKGRIKDFLLKQEKVSGIGNIYADEILHASGIHPRTPTGNIPEKKVAELWGHARAILSQAIELRGTSMRNFRDTEGRKGEFKGLCKVYGREGDPCLRKSCGGVIQRELVGNRSAHFCPSCQKFL